MDNVSLEGEEALKQVHNEMLQEFIPVILSLSLLSFIGIVGNAFAIGFYGFYSRRTPTIYLITALAVTDWLVCVLLVHTIIEIALNVYYTNVVTCKIFHFLIHWAIATSVLVLCLISIDRYRRICKPLNKQITLKISKKIVMICVFTALLLSIRDLVNFDIIEIDVHTGVNGTSLVGHYCTTTDDPSLKVSVLVFINVDALLVVFVMTTLLVTYGNIVWTICRRVGHNGLVPRSESNRTEGNSSSSGDITHTEETVEPSNKSVNSELSMAGNVNQGKAMYKTSLKKSEKRITLLMLTVSVGFIICFVPYFVIKLGLRSYKRASDLELSAETQFGIRLVYVNSFLNPVIFCLFNPQFRKYIANIIVRGISVRGT